MRVIIGIENNFEQRSLAWALDHPGCFAYGMDADDAFSAIPAAWGDYAVWVARHGNSIGWQDYGDVEFHVAETWDVYSISEYYELVEDGYEVGAWFLHDWKPLGEEDIQRAVRMFAWSRSDLLEAVGDLSNEDLDAEREGERWSITGILKHIGGAEWWYMDRLGLAFPREQVPKDAMARIEKVREHFLEALSSLAGEQQVVGVDGEFWSPRKMLRRALWHERDHTAHIHKLRRV